MPEVMLVQPQYEVRTDTAERHLEIENGPVLVFERTWGARKGQVVRWRVQAVSLLWESGELYRLRFSGARMRKDGQPSQGHGERENDSFAVNDGKVVPMQSRDYPTDWAQSIVGLYGGQIPDLRKHDRERLGTLTLRRADSAIGPHTIIRA